MIYTGYIIIPIHIVPTDRRRWPKGSRPLGTGLVLCATSFPGSLSCLSCHGQPQPKSEWGRAFQAPFSHTGQHLAFRIELLFLDCWSFPGLLRISFVDVFNEKMNRMHNLNLRNTAMTMSQFGYDTDVSDIVPTRIFPAFKIRTWWVGHGTVTGNRMGLRLYALIWYLADFPALYKSE